MSMITQESVRCEPATSSDFPVESLGSTELAEVWVERGELSRTIEPG